MCVSDFILFTSFPLCPQGGSTLTPLTTTPHLHSFPSRLLPFPSSLSSYFHLFFSFIPSIYFCFLSLVFTYIFLPLFLSLPSNSLCLPHATPFLIFFDLCFLASNLSFFSPSSFLLLLSFHRPSPFPQFSSFLPLPLSSLLPRLTLANEGDVA